MGSSSSRLSDTVSCSTGVRPAALSLVDPQQLGELRLALEQVGGVDEREQLGGLVPPGARGVLLDLADDLGQGALRTRPARSSRCTSAARRQGP